MNKKVVLAIIMIAVSLFFKREIGGIILTLVKDFILILLMSCLVMAIVW